jgi:hypothetical protein
MEKFVMRTKTVEEGVNASPSYQRSLSS